MSPKRVCQVLKYGWKHAGDISDIAFDGKKRIMLFIDILDSFAGPEAEHRTRNEGKRFAARPMAERFSGHTPFFAKIYP